MKCLQYLVSSGLSVTHVLGARNDQGETPRDVAALFGKTDVVEYSVRVEKERDAAGVSPDLAFPAHIAAFQGKLEELQQLVETGVVNVNERDDHGLLSLFHCYFLSLKACRCRSIEIELLFRYKQQSQSYILSECRQQSAAQGSRAGPLGSSAVAARDGRANRCAD